MESLNFDFVEVDAGRAVFAGIPGDHAYNPIGTVHGGYAATLLDSACGCAVHSRLTAAQAYTRAGVEDRVSQGCHARLRIAARRGPRDLDRPARCIR